ncbi:tetratricopeptide repeat protein [Tundrisphaera sp. TA3]|uniref:tetratricopeptide repeat protein n=1 Tax=Tundrisphaera sp. TA3 TaxID=3435775 RepID=UPI003EBD7B52
MPRSIPVLRIVILGWAAGSFASGAASGADIDEAADFLRTGRYEDCAREAAAGIVGGAWDERWFALKIRAEMAQGHYAEARAALDASSRRHATSVALFLLGREVRRFSGLADREPAAMDAMERIIVTNPRRYASAEGQVALGRFLVRRGYDPKKVLDQFYDPVVKNHPGHLDAYFAMAELALDKQDYGLAAESLKKAPEQAAEEPRFHYLTALAYSQDDRARAEKALLEALAINPKYVDALILQADGLIDAEKYDEAEAVLAATLAVNPREPRAWALRAVLAHLLNNPEGEDKARLTALEPWATNPEVDTLIGRKLAEKYRFAEGATAQRKALAFDPDHLPAKIQLCEALLRLGQEAEGWKLADEIFRRDAYNVVAFNLIALRDYLAKFRVLEADGLVVHMDPREADLYGARVLDLLKRARSTLGSTYEVALPGPVIVEIFPRKQEFAVRTFGLPGADGLLGVCFGRVITANSPASQGENPSNWEAVLWHELCHAITLTKTRNKMPRWLSEGISVYEEGRSDPAWRGAINPRFRAMILGEELTPLSKLSSAFLGAKSALHLQFAYHESAMAVEFLVEKAGSSGLNAILDDLGAGLTINEALPKHARMTLEEMDRSFADFARAKASAVAPEATWEPVDLPDDAESTAVAAWLKDHPKSFAGRQLLAKRLIAEEKWEAARAAIREFQALDPTYAGAENASMMLAAVHKRLGDTDAERRALEEVAGCDGDALPAYLRLIELDEAAGRWEDLARNARRALAVQPLTVGPHRALARAGEHTDHRDEAISEYRAVALLDDTDPADVHFRLAGLLRQSGRLDEARREVLKALEEAPRFRDAHKLLLELTPSQASAEPRP